MISDRTASGIRNKSPFSSHSDQPSRIESMSGFDDVASAFMSLLEPHSSAALAPGCTGLAMLLFNGHSSRAILPKF